MVQGGESCIGPFLCGNCAVDPPLCEWIEAWGEYKGGLERLLQAFKFERHDFLGAALGDLLVDAFDRREDMAFDFITAVPLHGRKLRERGYNQSALLGRHLSSATSLPFRSAALRRIAPGKPQSTLPRDERRRNVRRAFAADPKRVEGRSVLLVDDVCTTGATIDACARVLLAAGASRVCALAVARA
jgi:ComF family protein